MLLSPFARRRAKAYWRRHEATGCPHADRLLEVAALTPGSRVLEFGANDGGNLVAALETSPDVQAVGIDLHPRVLGPAAVYPGRYQGFVGDETTLAKWPDGAFTHAWTVSVLDHLPRKDQVLQVLEDLIRLAPRVILIEPAIAGVEGNVSGRRRGDVDSSATRPEKRFAEESYLWNYASILTRWHLKWTVEPCPLHSASLGPYYQRYVIAR